MDNIDPKDILTHLTTSVILAVTFATAAAGERVCIEKDPLASTWSVVADDEEDGDEPGSCEEVPIPDPDLFVPDHPAGQAVALAARAAWPELYPYWSDRWVLIGPWLDRLASEHPNATYLEVRRAAGFHWREEMIQQATARMLLAYTAVGTGGQRVFKCVPRVSSSTGSTFLKVLANVGILTGKESDWQRSVLYFDAEGKRVAIEKPVEGSCLPDHRSTGDGIFFDLPDFNEEPTLDFRLLLGGAGP